MTKTKPHISQRARDCLTWRFGSGSMLIERGSNWHDSVARLGIVGQGGSVAQYYEPDCVALAMYGHVDRALCALDDVHREVLELAYGDFGAAATGHGVRESDRWRTIVHFTPSCRAYADAWAAERQDSKDFGAVGLRWWMHVTTGKTTEAERKQVKQVESDARDLLRSAEFVFQLCLTALEQGQRDIRIGAEQERVRTGRKVAWQK